VKATAEVRADQRRVHDPEPAAPACREHLLAHATTRRPPTTLLGSPWSNGGHRGAAEILWMAVRADRRGCGIAAALLDQVLDELARDGVRVVEA